MLAELSTTNRMSTALHPISGGSGVSSFSPVLPPVDGPESVAVPVPVPVPVAVFESVEPVMVTPVRVGSPVVVLPKVVSELAETPLGPLDWEHAARAQTRHDDAAKTGTREVMVGAYNGVPCTMERFDSGMLRAP